MDSVDGGDAAEVSELLVVVLVGRTDLVKVLTRPRLLGEGSNRGICAFFSTKFKVYRVVQQNLNENCS